MSSTTEFKLPHDPLTALDTTRAPSPVAVHLLRQELYTNSRSIFMDGFHHGHLGLVMPVNDFTTLTGAAYIAPVYPDVPDYHLQPDVATRQEWEASYKQHMIDANVAKALSNHLMKLIIQAVPPTYIAILKDVVHGFAEVSPKQMLAHLMNNFGVIEPEDLEENLENLRAPWNPSTSIHEVFASAQLCRQIATLGGDPISEATVVRALATKFEKSGVFGTQIMDWNNKPQPDKTLDNLITHFLQADKNRLRSDKHVREVLAANEATTIIDKANPQYSYCWTHGRCGNLKHTSATCKFPATGHIKDATFTNQKGGCADIFKPFQGRGDNSKGRQRPDAKEAAAKAAEKAKAANAAYIEEAVNKALAAFVAAQNRSQDM
jgi:hypothetical protein